MLGEGLRAGLAHLGIAHRTVCYLEREAHAASVLAARCEEGSLDAAPVWSDLLTFDAAAWHGAVDCIAAGFPCQDLSLAGRRAGLDGQRSGLFFDILDIADACGARFLFLENVAGIASATASVVDEAEGALDERAAARVLGELADRGWDAEWLTLSASDVGATHGRSRWFCWAWRRQVGHARLDAGSAEHGQQPQGASGRAWQSSATGGSGNVDDAGRLQRRSRHEQDRPCAAEAGRHEALNGLTDRGDVLAHAERAERRQERARVAGAVEGNDARGREEDGGLEPADAVLGHADQLRQQQPHHADGAEPRRDAWAGAGGSSGIVADTGCSDARRGQHIAGASWFASEYHAGNSTVVGARLFAPGPSDTAWGHIIARQPELAPALEPAFRGVVNGLAFDMDDSRAARLKCVGNGVVPLCAAAAFVVLFQRSGITT